MSNTVQGLEFVGLDLPDSVGEVIACFILVLQGQQVLALVSRIMHAGVKRGSDHGVKAQGEGWLPTVALLEGNNLATVESTGFSDVYVVFSCNGRTKTSSIKFQKSDPLWNGMFLVSVFNNWHVTLVLLRIATGEKKMSQAWDLISYSLISLTLLALLSD
ncbi:hypothetical protein AgCh_032138 [Apium graveolens]